MNSYLKLRRESAPNLAGAWHLQLGEGLQGHGAAHCADRPADVRCTAGEPPLGASCCGAAPASAGIPQQGTTDWAATLRREASMEISCRNHPEMDRNGDFDQRAIGFTC